VWWHGGPPGLFQVPLCPILDVKINKSFLEFFEKLYFWGFLEIDK
jgi:hypothetical protein